MKNKCLALLAIVLVFSACDKDEVQIAPVANQVPLVKQEVAYEVNVTENISYAEGLSHESLNSANATVMPLVMDAYIPKNDLKNRPLLLLIHGGGFSGGSKQQESLVAMAHYFAGRGFVVFSIDYRLRGDKGTVPQDWIDATTDVPAEDLGQLLAMYPAHRDAKAALRWIIANAATYHIDTDYITVGGGSAGATTSIGVGVSSLNDFKDEISESIDNTLSTTNLSQSYEVQTIIDFWGSDRSLEILEVIYGYQRFDSDSPALFIAHGTEDPTVPFSSAEELKTTCENHGIDHVFYPLQGRGHGSWNATVDGKSLSDLSFDFIVSNQKLVLE